MKKKLEAELISIAHEILKLKESSDIGQLQEYAKEVYEKLTILHFAETHFRGVQPTIGQIRRVVEESNEETSVGLKATESLETDPLKKIENSSSINEEQELLPTFQKKVGELQAEPIEETRPEHIIESINEKVSEDLFVPAKTISEENILLSEPIYEKNDAKEIGTLGDSMPILDKEEDHKPKSLNDQLKRVIHIGLNDRLAFIKNLFGGSTEDYNRVLSQLNTLHSKSGAEQFIKNMVKPDYNNWEGKLEYEERFLEIVFNKFEF